MIGILQGRLTRPWNGKLQCFPRDAWEAEFELARSCGFEAVEPFVETERNGANPVWTSQGRARLRELAKAANVAVPTLCADAFMGTPFISDPDGGLAILEELCGCGFRQLVLPFFERAELKTPEDRERLIDVLGRARPRGVTLALETTLPAADLIPLVDRLGVTVCYDLGNTTALGHDLPGDIRKLGRRISHVHIKDKRRSDGQNVLLGTGDSDFAGSFRALREIGYEGDFTLETFRGEDPIATARAHREFVRSFLP